MSLKKHRGPGVSGAELIDKAIALKAVLEERRLAMLDDFQVGALPSAKWA